LKLVYLNVIHLWHFVEGKKTIPVNPQTYVIDLNNRLMYKFVIQVSGSKMNF